MSTICDGYQVFLKVESPGHPKTTYPLSPASGRGIKELWGISQRFYRWLIPETPTLRWCLLFFLGELIWILHIDTEAL